MCTCCWWLLVVYLSGCWEKHEKQLNLKRRLFNAGLIVLSTALQWDEVHLKKRQFASESLRAWEGLRHPIHCSCLLLFWEQCTCLAQSPAPILAPTNPHVSSTNRGVWALSCTSNHWTRLLVKARRQATLNCTGKPDACHKKWYWTQHHCNCRLWVNNATSSNSWNSICHSLASSKILKALYAQKFWNSVNDHLLQPQTHLPLFCSAKCRCCKKMCKFCPKGNFMLSSPVSQNLWTPKNPWRKTIYLI